MTGQAFPGKKSKGASGNFFQQRVLEIVRAIPPGSVLTYGQVAALADTPRAARQVGESSTFMVSVCPGSG